MWRWGIKVPCRWNSSNCGCETSARAAEAAALPCSVSFAWFGPSCAQRFPQDEQLCWQAEKRTWQVWSLSVWVQRVCRNSLVNRWNIMLKFFLFPFTQGNLQFISRVRSWHHKFPPELLSPVMWEFRPLGLPRNSYNGEAFPHEEIISGKLQEELYSQQREVTTTIPQHWGPAQCCAHNKLTRRWRVKHVHHPGTCRTLTTKSYRASFHSARGWELQTTPTAVTYKEMHWENVILILLSQGGAATTHKRHLSTWTDTSKKD